MFKKLYEKINKTYEKIDNIYKHISDTFHENLLECCKIKKVINNHCSDIESQLRLMSKTIESQQRTIEQLTNALKDKYEHGLFVFSEDCKIPMVIRNGKELTNDMTSYFGIDWSHGETPNIRIEQFAGTCSDSER